ncbi:MAG: glycosyl hydrolase [Pseudomonadota bacterium]
MKRALLDQAVARMLARIDSTLSRPGEGFPHYADPATGQWTRSSAGDWTGGFWCGLLWLAALRTGEARYRDQARAWALRLRPRAASKSVFKGFLFWYGAELGSELFADPVARELSAEGARGLMQMYSRTAQLIPLGTEAEEASDVGLNEANIDALPGTAALLLSHGTTLGCDEMARRHVRRHIALCVRDDGSVCQSATFDPADGRLVRRYTHKGIRDDSTWARAQAWGMLGLAQTLAWRETEFRDAAARVADWWLDHVPADHVAFWDFDDPAIPDTNRDTSATAIAAAALLKLARLVPERAERYRAAAEAAVEQLVSRYLTPVSADDRREPGILTGGCFNKRLGVATNHELIWGDYFLFESLLALDGCFVPERV